MLGEAADVRLVALYTREKGLLLLWEACSSALEVMFTLRGERASD